MLLNRINPSWNANIKHVTWMLAICVKCKAEVNCFPRIAKLFQPVEILVILIYHKTSYVSRRHFKRTALSPNYFIWYSVFVQFVSHCESWFFALRKIGFKVLNISNFIDVQILVASWPIWQSGREVTVASKLP